MSKSRIATLAATAVVVACVAFVVTLLLIKAMWAWTVPDLFPAAVQQGLVARSISWLAAAKIAIFVAILSGLCRGSQTQQPQERGSN